MFANKSFFRLVVGLLLPVSYAHAAPGADNAFKHPVYVGGGVGYGATTWRGLVPSKVDEAAAITVSTPIRVNEGGVVGNFFAGYEFSPFFALEAGYTHFPKATVSFDEMSLFTFENEGKTEFTTHTELLTLMGKIMLIIPKTSMRLYSGVGVADIHRRDDIVERWRVSPTFSVGINYNLSEHFMGEVSGNYTTGYGESELNPVKDYIPFLYSVVFRLAYRI